MIALVFSSLMSICGLLARRARRLRASREDGTFAGLLKELEALEVPATHEDRGGGAPPWRPAEAALLAA